MNWGKSIVLVFVLFASFIGIMVFQMCRERIDLVRDDYYQDEIAYQQQIDRALRTAKLSESPQIQINQQRNQLTFTLPSGWERGRLVFYRPSDRQLDRTVSLKPNQQVVSITDLIDGLWRVKLNWQQGGEEFYYERVITKR
ncbi:hypothetical protein GCM10027592_52900 [Spirosoma flavus]